MTLGVVGTLVWDSIHYRDGRPGPIEEWGGIAYALEAFSAALPDDWELRPIVKVGRDRSEEAFRFLRGLPRVRVEPGVRVVPESNNRVHLRYLGQLREAERLEGGVPPWSWVELGPLASECDALYVNFISGFEMDLEAAQALRAGFRGPIYADLHSLFLGIGALGDRIPRPLARWAEWLRSFDAVQMNETEFDLLGLGQGTDPWELAARVVGADLKLVAVTLGARGSAYIASASFADDPFRWPASRGALASLGPARSAKVASEGEAEGDPTGCGDVWGATFFARLLAGDGLESAMATANRWAGRNLSHRGARGLGLHLAGRLATGEGVR